MGFWSWLVGGKKPSRKQGRAVARSRGRNDRLNRELRAAGINPDLALCTECGEWYNVRNSQAVDRHAH